ncbi:MAG: septum site-determining protein MinC [Propionivibrio sp.]|uniref:septum site-determining protein MinC n=1 Tax=Propionivibrio sp. TaxID=2212460 RepID=UPI001A5CB077|nr:septum site-determining protein MinC [Propionivibrio sp.]MBL8413417.1 septum site-determining protein MinC [Propionivibrio sp.]
MARANKKLQLIEFKGTTLPVVSVTLHSLQSGPLARAATELFGDETFFDGDAAVLELDKIAGAESTRPVDWAALGTLFNKHGLNVIGVRGGSDELRASAAAVGLPSFAAFKRVSRAADESTASAAPVQAGPVQEVAPASVQETPPPPAQPAFTPTLVIDRPLRSGQQAYARGGDLVVLAAVNAGAEVIADGSIHIYAPLRGRALAGASGSTGARIFTTRFEAELVSIAGVYRTFDAGIPDQLAGRPVQVQLSPTADEASSHLIIESLATN